MAWQVLWAPKDTIDCPKWIIVDPKHQQTNNDGVAQEIAVTHGEPEQQPAIQRSYDGCS